MAPCTRHQRAPLVANSQRVLGEIANLTFAAGNSEPYHDGAAWFLVVQNLLRPNQSH
jgi:hypothetical protein